VIEGKGYMIICLSMKVFSKGHRRGEINGPTNERGYRTNLWVRSLEGESRIRVISAQFQFVAPTHTLLCSSTAPLKSLFDARLPACNPGF
jgi:hypothetical protein